MSQKVVLSNFLRYLIVAVQSIWYNNSIIFKILILEGEIKWRAKTF